MSLVQQGESAILEISDQGPGISEEHLDHIFERFYRASNQDEPARGSGLGLYICEQIVRAHEGSIRVDSMLGEGASFCIELPMEMEAIPA